MNNKKIIFSVLLVVGLITVVAQTANAQKWVPLTPNSSIMIQQFNSPFDIIKHTPKICFLQDSWIGKKILVTGNQTAIALLCPIGVNK